MILIFYKNLNLSAYKLAKKPVFKSNYRPFYQLFWLNLHKKTKI